jgi:hypothetical protein
MEECYPDGIKQRGIDPGHEVLQVFAGPMESDKSESGEDSACWRRLPVIGAREMRLESEGKAFEVDQREEASDDRVG